MCYFSITTYIDGVRLDEEVFSRMAMEAQDIICAKVSTQLAYLRTLECEGWYYGRIHRQAWSQPPPDIEVNTSTPRTVTSPFTTYEALVKNLIEAFQMQEAVSIQSQDWPAYHMEQVAELVSTLESWKPVEPKLTWLDPKIRNIVAVPIGGDEKTALDWDVYFVDWEDLGWYPAWLQAKQVRDRGSVFVRYVDPMKGMNARIYREKEILDMQLKDFDPGYDREKGERVSRYWRFY
jgi:hypothetical protein